MGRGTWKNSELILLSWGGGGGSQFPGLGVPQRKNMKYDKTQKKISDYHNTITITEKLRNHTLSLSRNHEISSHTNYSLTSCWTKAITIIQGNCLTLLSILQLPYNFPNSFFQNPCPQMSNFPNTHFPEPSIFQITNLPKPFSQTVNFPKPFIHTTFYHIGRLKVTSRRKRRSAVTMMCVRSNDL